MLFVVDAFENARNLCDRYYMNSPELVLEEFNGNNKLHIFFLCYKFDYKLVISNGRVPFSRV